MDIEWLLSTLFDASLLSTSSRRQRRLFFVLFCVSFRGSRDKTREFSGSSLSLPGNYVAIFAWTGRGRTRHAYSFVKDGAVLSISEA